MELGQPLHAFDADQISGNKVVVKKLKKGTKFITLDGLTRELGAEDLMICNAEDGNVYWWSIWRNSFRSYR